MKNSATFAAAVFALLSLPGCATKDLGRQGELSSYERDAMSCKDIEMEMTRVVGFVEYVNKSMEHNWYDIPAVLEKRWIGNTREKSAALESANIRMVQLWSLHDSKGCNGGVAMQPMGLPVQKPEVEERINPPAESSPAQPAATPAAKPQPSPAGA